MSNKFVYICSPYYAETAEGREKNLEIARKAGFHALSNGFIPIIPHLMYDSILDDKIPALRKRGLSSAIELLKLCDLFWFYKSRMSSGMKQEYDYALSKRMRMYEFHFHYKACILTELKHDGRNSYEFEVIGKPVGKESVRFAAKAGRIFTYLPRKSRRYMQKIETCARMAGVGKMERCLLEITINIPCKAKTYKTRPNEYYERLQRPDDDNVVKCVKDALEGIAYENDSHVLDTHVQFRFSKTLKEPTTYIRLQEVDWTDYLID